MKTSAWLGIMGASALSAAMLSGCASNDEPQYTTPPPTQSRVVVEPPPRRAAPPPPQARVERPMPTPGENPLTPRPGPDFNWIPAQRDAKGFLVPGHWEYTGPVRHNQVWVPRHRVNGQWVVGEWREVRPPRAGMTYVPGHYGPDAIWIDGYWE